MQQGTTLANFPQVVSHLHNYAHASDSTENRGLLTEQAQLQPEKACPGSKLLHLLVQAQLLPIYCFAEETGYYKTKLAYFASHPVDRKKPSFPMPLACSIATKSRLYFQTAFTVTALLHSPIGHKRYRSFSAAVSTKR